jgi:hypothetical protein
MAELPANPSFRGATGPRGGGHWTRLFFSEHHENIGVGLVVFPVSIILLSIIFGWLRMKTGSIWSSSIAHGATDSFGASLALLFFLGGPKFTFVGYLGILSWIPLGALCAWILLTQAADYNDSSLTTEGSAEHVGDRV